MNETEPIESTVEDNEVFSPGDTVCLITFPRTKLYVETITIGKGWVNYLLWDGSKDVTVYADWQVKKYVPTLE